MNWRLSNRRLKQKYFTRLNNHFNVKVSMLQPGTPEVGGRRGNYPLPFNILKTREQRGQIVLFKIVLQINFC